jgi:redox-sensitive bicupin YhaK (pirin superfamily)
MEKQMNTTLALAERNALWFNLHNPPLALPAPVAVKRPRGIALLTGGRRHGEVTRLASPSDLGEMIKPFVFLDHALVAPRAEPLFGIHPHSGIATLTTVLSGAIHYEDSTGKSGVVPTGGVEWMKAGGGVWHDGGPTKDGPVRAFQLWVALQASEENAPAVSEYVAPEEIEREGPARVILGRYGAAKSAIRSAPGGINYLHVTLKDGQRWKYTPPAIHHVAWLAIDTGSLRSVRTIDAGQIAVFEESNEAIELEARGDT